MKEHGFLFKGAMVRKILDKEKPKTQTRRPITFHNSITEPRITKKEWDRLSWSRAVYAKQLSRRNNHPFWIVESNEGARIKVMPRVQVGDVLYVKETFGVKKVDDNGLQLQGLPLFEYQEIDVPERASEDNIVKAMALNKMRMQSGYTIIFKVDFPIMEGWRSSLHMPRWASRIDLSVKAMRSERIQDIRWPDIRSEGVSEGEIRLRFQRLWDSINYTRGFGWETNHPVWIYDFERIKP
jgi:hypothetical protein